MEEAKPIDDIRSTAAYRSRVGDVYKRQGGISHHPSESVLESDVEASLNVGREFLLRLAKEVV